MLSEHSTAPLSIQLKDQLNQPFSLEQCLGKRVVLYFYPKDDTPGCTTQACGLRDQWADFEDLDVLIYGVSPDESSSHQKFIDKYQLPFPLICDPQHKLAEAFGCWGERKMYGKTFMGIHRTTFVINAEGKIEKVFAKVKPAAHTEQLLSYLKGEL